MSFPLFLLLRTGQVITTLPTSPQMAVENSLNWLSFQMGPDVENISKASMHFLFRFDIYFVRIIRKPKRIHRAVLGIHQVLQRGCTEFRLWLLWFSPVDPDCAARFGYLSSSLRLYACRRAVHDFTCKPGLDMYDKHPHYEVAVLNTKNCSGLSESLSSNPCSYVCTYTEIHVYRYICIHTYLLVIGVYVYRPPRIIGQVA